MLCYTTVLLHVCYTGALFSCVVLHHCSAVELVFNARWMISIRVHGVDLVIDANIDVRFQRELSTTGAMIT